MSQPMITFKIFGIVDFCPLSPPSFSSEPFPIHYLHPAESHKSCLVGFSDVLNCSGHMGQQFWVLRTSSLSTPCRIPQKLYKGLQTSTTQSLPQICLFMCLEIDASWPILCGANIHVRLDPHYPSQ